MSQSSDSERDEGSAGIFRAFLALFFNQGPPEPLELPSDAEPLFGPLARYSVLVVENDAVCRETTVQQLRGAGLNVLSASSASKGLEMVRGSTDEIAVLLLDCELPDFDISPWRALNHRLVIIGVLRSELKDVPPSRRERVAMLLRKPVAGDELVAAVKRVLDDSFGSAPAR